MKDAGVGLTSLVAATAGGALFFWLTVPLPWMLGALAVTAVIARWHGRAPMPLVARNFVRPIVGVLAGSAFTPGIVESLAESWDALLIVLGFSVAVILLGPFFFRLVGGFDRTTAYFASTPGGLSEMVLLGDSLGGDMRRLVVVHLTRIVVVVVTVPLFLQIWLGIHIGGGLARGDIQAALSPSDWLILGSCAVVGYAAGTTLRYRPGLMLFAMLLSAAVHVSGITEASPPAWLVIAAQIIIGTVVGGRFASIDRDAMQRTVLIGLAWAAAVLALVFLVAAASTLVVDRPFTAMLLALTPAGTTEIIVIGLALGIEVPFMVTCQVCRMLMVQILAPLLFGLFRSGQQAAPAPAAGDDPDDPGEEGSSEEAAR